MADQIILFHGEPGSNSLKVLQTMHEKGVPFESRLINLTKFEQHDPEYLKINPAGQVPALLHNGRVLTESTVINEYIDEVFDGPALSPSDPFERGQMRIWTKYVDEVFRPALSFLAWHRMIPGLVAKLTAEEFREKLDRIPLREKRDKWELAATGGFSEREIGTWTYQLQDTVHRMEKALTGHDWLVADMFTLADIAMFAMGAGLSRAYPEMMNEKDSPNAMAWVERMRARPGVAAALRMPNPTLAA